MDGYIRNTGCREERGNQFDCRWQLHYCSGEILAPTNLIEQLLLDTDGTEGGCHYSRDTVGACWNKKP